MLINVRFGTTLAKERERVLRMAKRYAINQRLSQERINILHQASSHSGLTASSTSSPFSASLYWTEEEKQFLLSSSQQPQNTLNNNGPLKFEYYHSPGICVQLADDAANIIVIRTKK